MNKNYLFLLNMHIGNKLCSNANSRVNIYATGRKTYRPHQLERTASGACAVKFFLTPSRLYW